MSTKDKLIASAQKNLEKGQIQKAIKDYHDLVKLEPKVDQFRQRLAELLSRANQTAEAIVQYDILAKEYTDKGFYPRAIAVYKQIQKLDASKADVYHKLAELNKKQGMIGNAMAEYRTLLDHYEKKKMIFESGDVLLKMAELEPENLVLQLRAIQFLIQSKILDKVNPAIIAAIEVFLKKSDSDKSQKLLETALPKLEDHRDLLFDLVNKLEKKGFVDQVLLVMKSLIKTAPDDPALLVRVAGFYQQVNDPANERLTLAHLVKINPSAKDCERLVRLYLEDKDYQRAQREIELHAALLTEAGCKDKLLAQCREALDSANKVSAAGISAPSTLLPELDIPAVSPVEPMPQTATIVPPAPVIAPPPVTPAPVAEVNSAEISLDFLEEFVGRQEELTFTPEVEVVVQSSTISAPLVEQEMPAAEVELDLAIDGEIEIDADELSFLDPSFGGAEAAVELPMELIGDTLPLEGESSGLLSAELELDLCSVDEVEVDETEIEILDELLEIEEVELEPEVEIESLTLDDAAETVEFVSELPADELVELDELEELEDIDEVALDELNDLIGSTGIEIEDNAESLVQPESAATTLITSGNEEFVFSDDLSDEIESILGGGEEAQVDESLLGVEDLDAFTAEHIEDGPLLDERDGEHLLGEDFSPDVCPQPQAVATESVDASILFDFTTELDEVEFYLQQGLPDNAEKVCRKLLQIDPENSQVLSKLDEVAVLRQAKAAPVATEEDDFFDLASEVLDDGAFRATAGLANVEDVDRYRFDSVFSEFKKGIESQIDSEDAEAHYNLGIAYKEMGLIDDAVGELQKAMADRSRLADCLTLIGICRAESGAFDKAEEVFHAGISHPDLSPSEKIGIQFELGLVYEIWGRPADALACFEEVAKVDLFFRNAGEKVKELRTSLGVEEIIRPTTAESQPSTVVSNKNRVSFL